MRVIIGDQTSEISEEVEVVQDGVDNSLVVHRHNEDDCDDMIVAVEVFDGRLRVIVWEPGIEEPVGIHDLGEAKNVPMPKV